MLVMEARKYRDDVRQALFDVGWFEVPGAYVLVDGQYGSTGKGLLAGVLGRAGLDRITHVTTNAGPNSGHTAWLPQAQSDVRTADTPGIWDEQRLEKVMTQQIPIAGVLARRLKRDPIIYMNAGAIIDPEIFNKEAREHTSLDNPVCVHPAAAIILDAHKQAEANPLSGAAKIASTAKGTGAALAAKINREGNTAAYVTHQLEGSVGWVNWNWRSDCVFVETPQGFSLGLNSRFYPHVTSRECTVMQAISDARIPHSMVRRVAACYRTYPIRVGNTPNGSSGMCYQDQEEIDWSDLKISPEYTSVTNRKRRIFTWSRQQFRESVAANRPDTLFINFMNYLEPRSERDFLKTVIGDYMAVIGDRPELVLLGYGPKSEDVRVA